MINGFVLMHYILKLSIGNPKKKLLSRTIFFDLPSQQNQSSKFNWENQTEHRCVLNQIARAFFYLENF